MLGDGATCCGSASYGDILWLVQRRATLTHGYSLSAGLLQWATYHVHESLRELAAFWVDLANFNVLCEFRSRMNVWPILLYNTAINLSLFVARSLGCAWRDFGDPYGIPIVL